MTTDQPDQPDQPDPPKLASLTPEHNHAIVGVSVHPTKPPRFVYSLPALVDRERFLYPDLPPDAVHRRVWDMVMDLVATHGDAAPLFIDDAVARAERNAPAPLIVRTEAPRIYMPGT